MKNAQVNDLLVIVPRQKFFEFSYNDYSMTLYADSLDSACDLVYKFVGFSVDNLHEVSFPTTQFLLMCVDSYFCSVFSSSLCRVPLSETHFFADIVKYFRFNVSSDVKVLFE